MAQFDHLHRSERLDYAPRGKSGSGTWIFILAAVVLVLAAILIGGPGSDQQPATSDVVLPPAGGEATGSAIDGAAPVEPQTTAPATAETPGGTMPAPVDGSGN